MPKKTLYAVAEGEYSDYRIRGIFSTEVKARAFIERGGGDEVEEYVLDEMEGYGKRRHFRCKIHPDSGAITQEWDFESLASLRARSLDSQEWSGEIVVTSLVSAEHARKLAAEARQAHLRKATEAPHD